MKRIVADYASANLTASWGVDVRLMLRWRRSKDTAARF
jgi:hypothetical protein